MTQNLENDIFKFIKEMTQVSFLDLKYKYPNHFKGFEDFIIKIQTGTFVLWYNISKNFCIALNNLRQNKKVEFTPTTKELYILNGYNVEPVHPIAKNMRKSKDTRFLFTVMNVK